jgi:hypothetical protein
MENEPETYSMPAIMEPVNVMVLDDGMVSGLLGLVGPAMLDGAGRRPVHYYQDETSSIGTGRTGRRDTI